MSPALARAIASFSDSLAVASVSPSFASLPLMASAKYSAAGRVALAATAANKPTKKALFSMTPFPFSPFQKQSPPLSGQSPSSR